MFWVELVQMLCSNLLKLLANHSFFNACFVSLLHDVLFWRSLACLFFCTASSCVCVADVPKRSSARARVRACARLRAQARAQARVLVRARVRARSRARAISSTARLVFFCFPRKHDLPARGIRWLMLRVSFLIPDSDDRRVRAAFSE